MRYSSTRDWLIDSIIIIGLSVVAVYLLPFISYVFAFQHSRTLFWVQFVAFDYLVPYLVTCSLVALVAAWLIRHRRLLLASLPSVLLCAFYFIYLTFGPFGYSWGHTWIDFVLVSSWLLSIGASALCAWFILRRRQPNKSRGCVKTPGGIDSQK